MLDRTALGAAIEKHQPDFIVPEIEAIRTEILADYKAKGFTVVPSASPTGMPEISAFAALLMHSRWQRPKRTSTCAFSANR